MVGMKLIKAQVLCVRLMAQWGVLGDGNLKWKWGGFNNKKTNCGECYVYEGERKILLGKPYVLNNTEATVTNTILHEIAHALDAEVRGESKHDKHWRKWCRVVGCTEERCNSKAKVMYRYNAKCCGNTYGRHRTRSGVTYHCNSCDKELFVKQVVAKKYKLDHKDIISVR
jgi:predicted SprT family Zn-dependent metalloprotease